MPCCHGFCVRIHFFAFISTYSLDGCIDVVKDVYDNMDYNGSRTEAKYWIYRIYKIWKMCDSFPLFVYTIDNAKELEIHIQWQVNEYNRSI